MTKQDFIAAIAEKTGFTKKDSDLFAKAFIEELSDVLKAGDSISFQGFGTFKTADVAARESRNPATGEKIMVEAHKKVVFTASSALKEAVR